MGGFSKPSDAFGTESTGDDFGVLALKVEGCLEVYDVVPVSGDGVTEKEDALSLEEGLRGVSEEGEGE